MGCVLPVMKQPEVFKQMPVLLQQAMDVPIAPLPELAWIATMRQSGAMVLSRTQEEAPAGAAVTDREIMEKIQRALGRLDKYCGRFGTPAREVIQARKLLQEIDIDDDDAQND
jgi:hypothetical protein